MVQSEGNLQELPTRIHVPKYFGINQSLKHITQSSPTEL